MSTEKIRIRIKAYDHRILDNAAKKIVETVRRSGGKISGPVPLPTEVEKFTILIVEATRFYSIIKMIFVQPPHNT